MVDLTLYAIYFLDKNLNPWYMMLYSHMNDWFHQKLHFGLHKKILINCFYNNQLVVLDCCVDLILTLQHAKVKAGYYSQHYQHVWVFLSYSFISVLRTYSIQPVLILLPLEAVLSAWLHLDSLNFWLIWPWLVRPMISYFQCLDMVFVRK